MLVLHWRRNPSLIWFCFATRTWFAAIYEMVQLEGALEVLDTWEIPKSMVRSLSIQGETESKVLAPCEPVGMGANFPNIFMVSLFLFSWVRLAGLCV